MIKREDDEDEDTKESQVSFGASIRCYEQGQDEVTHTHKRIRTTRIQWREGRCDEATRGKDVDRLARDGLIDARLPCLMFSGHLGICCWRPFNQSRSSSSEERVVVGERRSGRGDKENQETEVGKPRRSRRRRRPLERE